MTIKRKIEIQNHDLKKHSDMISRGAKVLEDSEETHGWKTISLRIPNSLIEDVNKEVKKRYGLSRTGWILEAMQEKLKRTI